MRSLALTTLKQLPLARRLMCLAATGGPQPELAENWNESLEKGLWSESRRNRMTPLVAHAVLQSVGATKLQLPWKRVHQECLEKIVKLLTELDKVSARLSESGVDCVILKNAGLARAGYVCPGCCPMDDLDLLIAPHNFVQANALLQKMGYYPADRLENHPITLDRSQTPDSLDYIRHEQDGESLWIDLHTRFLSGRLIAHKEGLDTEQIIAHSRSIPTSSARILPTEENLLHASLHAARHSYLRAPGLRIHLDVTRIVSHDKLDWDRFCRMVTVLRARNMVFFALFLPYLLFNAQIPEAVLRELAPPAWKRRLIETWLRRAGLFDPQQKKFSRLGYPLFNALLFDSITDLRRAAMASSNGGFHALLHRLWSLAFQHRGT